MTNDIKKWYITNYETFEQSLNGGSTAPFHRWRKDAITDFSELNFPTTKDEEWRFTNIAPLLQHNFVPQLRKPEIDADVNRFVFEGMDSHLLVFLNGHFAPELSSIKELPKGVYAGSLADAIKENRPEIEEHFGKYAPAKNHIFTALSTAYVQDGAFISVPAGASVDLPFHLIFITSSGDNKVISQPRNLIVAGKSSQLSVVEHYVSIDDSVYFTNSVNEIVVSENAFVDHIKIQQENLNSFHFQRMEVDQERNSNFTSHALSFGGSISRNEYNAVFNDEGGECTLNGLYLLEGNQLFDAHTLMDHAKPHCNSHEHYKGILADKSRGVFNGKVIVRKDAQKTNAFQENNNIILSNEALVNTKPQLEIFADDVKCSHGATVGQLDMESMFYLKSRGIGEESARAILIHAFAADVIKSIKNSHVRSFIGDILNKRFDN